MDERILKWLFDIKIAIDKRENYFKNSERDFFLVSKNTMLKRELLLKRDFQKQRQ